MAAKSFTTANQNVGEYIRKCPELDGNYFANTIRDPPQPIRRQYSLVIKPVISSIRLIMFSASVITRGVITMSNTEGFVTTKANNKQSYK